MDGVIAYCADTMSRIGRERVSFFWSRTTGGTGGGHARTHLICLCGIFHIFLEDCEPAHFLFLMRIFALQVLRPCLETPHRQLLRFTHTKWALQTANSQPAFLLISRRYHRCKRYNSAHYHHTLHRSIHHSHPFSQTLHFLKTLSLSLSFSLSFSLLLLRCARSLPCLLRRTIHFLSRYYLNTPRTPDDDTLSETLEMRKERVCGKF